MKVASLILVSATLLLGSCQKYEGPTQATGVVVDKHTRQVVPSAYVEVGSINGGWSGGGSGSGPSTQADANGRFSISFEAQEGKQYTLFAGTPGGYHSSYGDCPLLEGGRHNDNLQILADAPAWVNINCVDDPPYEKGWVFTSGYVNNVTGGYDEQSVGPGNYSFVRPVLAYDAGTIYWKTTTLSGASTEGRIPYNVAGLDTVTVTIHF